jgi:hypothetical protein
MWKIRENLSPAHNQNRGGYSIVFCILCLCLHFTTSCPLFLFILFCVLRYIYMIDIYVHIGNKLSSSKVIVIYSVHHYFYNCLILSISNISSILRKNLLTIVLSNTLTMKKRTQGQDLTVLYTFLVRWQITLVDRHHGN